MSEIRSKNQWLCIACGHLLGHIYGGEYHIDGEVKTARTSGPNLVVTCPECGALKTFYTSDPIVRAVYQLVTAISDVAARAMVESVATNINKK